MTPDEAVEKLDAIDAEDKEIAHGQADNILVQSVSQPIRDAYIRLLERADGFWYA